MYTTTHIQNLFSVSYETVRTYTREFKAYMSPTATPDKGEHRKYTYDDLKVFAQIVSMKHERKVYADIHVALAAGERTEIPEFTETEIEELALSRRGVIVAQELFAAKETIVGLEAKIIQFEQQAPATHEENIRLKAEIKLLKELLEVARDDAKAQAQQKQDAFVLGFDRGVEFKPPKPD